MKWRDLAADLDADLRELLGLCDRMKSSRVGFDRLTSQTEDGARVETGTKTRTRREGRRTEMALL